MDRKGEAFDAARQAIEDLVERYSQHRERYHASTYNEETARNEFINPFFEALGWDVANREGAAEQYKDVVHEEGIKVGDFTKAPDYTFRFGGLRKFFVEAKKPFVDLKDDPAPAYQLRRYAWSAKLPVSILTDFEEFVVYDTRIRPHEGDKAAVGRVLYLTFDEYVSRFAEIWDVFSKSAVLRGSFDRYADESKGKRGTSEVDAEFLKEIEEWRSELAKNLALRNDALSVDELNFAVQATIDRVVFLRFAEGSGAEEYGRLLALANGANTYKRLLDLYRKADQRYNSGLFDFQADRLTPRLDLDDKALKHILEHLYYPRSPYEFSVLPVEILGNVYEQFLGKVIRLTKGHQAKVEEKPEVKKAGGVFYTPLYIVTHIVRNTVGTLCANKSPSQIEKLKILDPACGSGSFLLGAYQYLLDHHLNWYRDHHPEKHKDAVYLGPGGWRLTTAEKRRILVNNIFGVDIDRQAVEVTKLSLLLKVLEGENDETLRQQALFGERALPSLEANIKCGNSLIGSDALRGELFPDPEEMRRINPFDWQREFPRVFEDGGFDAVIGNPPYIRIQMLQEWAPREVELYKELYRSAASGNYDIYVVFVEKGLSLLNESGRLGFILPHKFMNAKYGEGLRSILAEGKHLSRVVHFGDQQVFDRATTYTCLLFLQRNPAKSVDVAKVADLAAWRASGAAETGKVAAGEITTAEWNFAVGRGADLFKRLDDLPVKLGAIARRMYQGCITSADTVFLFKEHRRGAKGMTDVFSKELNAWVALESELLKPVVRSGEIARYTATPAALVLFPYTVRDETATLLDATSLRRTAAKTWEYLLQHKKLLEGREGGAFRDAEWYRFGRSQNLGMWEQPKLMVPYMVTSLASYLDRDGGLYFINVTTGGYGITLADSSGVSMAFVCGLLNSRLLDFYFKRVASTFHGGYFAANKQYIEQLPIRVPNPAAKRDSAITERVEASVEQRLRSAKQLLATNIPHARTQIERQIAALDAEIDQIVYELYSLTDGEIRLVEEQNRRSSEPAR